MPAYTIFNDKTLKLMASELPTTENVFLAISGVGKNKMEKYSAEFMSVISKFKSIAKPRKTSTTQKTFDFYKDRSNPTKIAKKRSLSITTFFSHLSQLYMERKKVELEKYITKETVNKVRVAFNTLDQKTELKPIYNKLNEEVSYWEIRLSVTLILKNG